GCQTTAFNPIQLSSLTNTLKDNKLYILALAYAAASVNGSANNKPLFLFDGLTYRILEDHY
ncbi:19128_t:CDS:2, partial [Funneliformis geosporum]